MIRHFFTPYVVLEIVAAYFFIHAYGFLNLVFEVIASAVLGLFFMFIPGLITDVLGAAIVAVAFFANLKNGGERKGGSEYYYEKFESGRDKPRDDGEIIDVEVVEEKRQIWKN